jgi:hypothetical protein
MKAATLVGKCGLQKAKAWEFWKSENSTVGAGFGWRYGKDKKELEWLNGLRWRYF